MFHPASLTLFHPIPPTLSISPPFPLLYSTQFLFISPLFSYFTYFTLFLLHFSPPFFLLYFTHFLLLYLFHPFFLFISPPFSYFIHFTHFLVLFHPLSLPLIISPQFLLPYFTDFPFLSSISPPFPSLIYLFHPISFTSSISPPFFYFTFLFHPISLISSISPLFSYLISPFSHHFSISPLCLFFFSSHFLTLSASPHPSLGHFPPHPLPIDLGARGEGWGLLLLGGDFGSKTSEVGVNSCLAVPLRAGGCTHWGECCCEFGDLGENWLLSKGLGAPCEHPPERRLGLCGFLPSPGEILGIQEDLGKGGEALTWFLV